MSAPNDAVPPADAPPPDQIRWERNPRGCSAVGCMYVAVGFFFVLLVAMLVLYVVRASGGTGPGGLVVPG